MQRNPKACKAATIFMPPGARTCGHGNLFPPRSPSPFASLVPLLFKIPVLLRSLFASSEIRICLDVPGKILEKTIALPGGLRNFFRLIFWGNFYLILWLTSQINIPRT
jgi:hypothetical protein